MPICGPTAALGALIPSSIDSGTKIGPNTPHDTPPGLTGLKKLVVEVSDPGRIEHAQASIE